MKTNIFKLIIVIIMYALLMYILPYLIPEYEELINKGILSSKITPELFSIIMNTVIYLVLFVGIVLLLKDDLKEDFLQVKLISKGKLIGQIAIGYGLLLGGSYLGSIITMILGGSGTSENQEAITRVLTSEYGFLMILCIAFIGPIVEELVFRKTLFKLCDKIKLHRYITIAITSILFGLIHVVSGGDIVEVFPYIFMGVAMGITYNMSKTLVAPTIVHIIQNSISVFSILVLLPLLEKLYEMLEQLQQQVM